MPTITLDGTADGNFPATDGTQEMHVEAGSKSRDVWCDAVLGLGTWTQVLSGPDANGHAIPAP